MTTETRFRELFESTYPVVARYGRHRGVTGQDLEDLLAATYEVAWRRFDRVPEGREAVPWLLAVALNHLRNHRRRQMRERTLIERLPAPEPAPGPPDAPTHGWRRVRAALARLPARDRELILLFTWDGLSSAEAAVVLGITPGAARTRLHRARARLAELLAEDDDEPRAPVARAAEREVIG